MPAEIKKMLGVRARWSQKQKLTRRRPEGLITHHAVEELVVEQVGVSEEDHKSQEDDHHERRDEMTLLHRHLHSRREGMGTLTPVLCSMKCTMADALRNTLSTSKTRISRSSSENYASPREQTETASTE